MQKLYTVSELARELGTTPRAIRFYEDKGLIAPRRAGQNRVYGARERGRLILVLRGKRLGFSLKEIREWLDLYDSDPKQVEQMKRLGDRINARIAQLKRQQRDIEATLAELQDIRTRALAHLARQSEPESVT
jgi:DNA-binding transcriptional MerR regulator